LERNKPNPALWKPTNRLVGFCFMFKREVLDRIGYLDERFMQGHYEDDDYCYRAIQAGYQLRIAGDVRVHHYGSLSFKKQTSEQLFNLVKTNHLKFIEKWGMDPHQNIET
jgi:GT2 family glycosyltransferase